MSDRKKKLRESWLKERRTGLGGTDAAAALGHSPYKSAYTLWLEKTERIEPEDISNRPEVYWGNILEPIIAKEYAKETGRRVDDYPRYQVLRHPTLDFLIATPDRKTEIFDPDMEAPPVSSRTTGPLEIKSAGFVKPDQWLNDPPVHYQIQLQHYLHVTGSNIGTFALLDTSRRQLYWVDVNRNDGFIEWMSERLEQFWERVQSNKEPPIDHSVSTLESLKRIYPEDTGELIALPDIAEEVVFGWEMTKKRIRRDEDRRRGFENEIRRLMGDATFGVLPDGTRVSLKTITRKAHHRPAKYIKESKYRVLRRENHDQ